MSNMKFSYFHDGNARGFHTNNARKCIIIFEIKLCVGILFILTVESGQWHSTDQDISRNGTALVRTSVSVERCTIHSVGRDISISGGWHSTGQEIGRSEE